MTWAEFWVVLACCALTMLACRALPLFLLKGKQLPDAVSRALGFIPPAAFAALVANDLLAPGMFVACRRAAGGRARRGRDRREDEIASVVRLGRRRVLRAARADLAEGTAGFCRIRCES